MRIAIRGMGTALPSGSVEQTDAAQAADRLRRWSDDAAADKKAQLLSILYRRSGVRKRHCVVLEGEQGDPLTRQTFYTPAKSLDDRGPTTKARMDFYQRSAPELAEQACLSALRDAGSSADEITHLVTVSCSGFGAPGFDLELYPRLGLSPETSRTHVGFMGCHGFLNGLRTARAYAATEPKAKVLVCAVELCSLHHQYTDEPQQVVANSLFADGAAAAILEMQDDERSPFAYRQLAANGSFRIPESEAMMTWKIGDHGFQMSLSPQVPELIQRELKPWLQSWLAPYGLSCEQIAHWAVHPGGPRILSATCEALGLPESATRISTEVLRECGNMSSPTVMFILDRMRREGMGPPLVALAFGPGLVAEAALFL
ncbi:MAG: type III polyketide synthase [Pirellulales bacterium]